MQFEAALVPGDRAVGPARPATLACLLACLFAAGCSGTLHPGGSGEPGDGDQDRDGDGVVDGDDVGGGGTSGGPVDAKGCSQAPRRPAWQMASHTVAQVRTIVAQVFGPAAADGQVQSLIATFPSDLKAKGFDTEKKTVSAQYLDAHIGLARRLATLAVEQAPVRKAIEAFAGKDCAGTMDLDAGCGLELARKLVSALARQPVPDGDVDAMLTTYKANKGKYQTEKAYAGFVASVLLSARSALRFDVAERAKTGNVDAHALGARLAMTLTSGLPDAALREKMEDQSILKRDVLAAEAKRLLRTSAGRTTLSHFAQQWLNLSLVKSPPGKTRFVATDDDSAAVARAAREEIGRLFETAVLDKKGTLRDFYTTEDVVPANDWLAKQYNVAKGTGPARTTAEGRRGLLTRVGFQLHGAHADWLPLAHRGYGVKVTMLCGAVGAFPDNVDTSIPASAPDVMSSRQYFETLTEGGICTGCHKAMNPYGYAMSAYSVTGEFLRKETVKNRKTSQEVDVDVNVRVAVPIDGKDVTVLDASEMSAAIGGSREAKACFASRFDQYAVGLADEPHCGVERTTAALEANDGTGTLEDAILAYVGSAEFRMR